MDLEELAARVGETLKRRGYIVATAESCTGGWVAQAITGVAGSSEWFDRGFVTYSNAAKQEMLGVGGETLARFGAVSEQTVREMAEGALRFSQALVSVAVSGIAGPTGGTPDKPVGMVWLAWAMNAGPTCARLEHFSGNREAVRRQATAAALQGILDQLEQ